MSKSDPSPSDPSPPSSLPLGITNPFSPFTTSPRPFSPPPPPPPPLGGLCGRVKGRLGDGGVGTGGRVAGPASGVGLRNPFFSSVSCAGAVVSSVGGSVASLIASAGASVRRSMISSGVRGSEALASKSSSPPPICSLSPVSLASMTTSGRSGKSPGKAGSKSVRPSPPPGPSTLGSIGATPPSSHPGGYAMSPLSVSSLSVSRPGSYRFSSGTSTACDGSAGASQTKHERREPGPQQVLAPQPSGLMVVHFS
mmetsp:Transcript_13938/g.40105  ORF Transcript_13938/g.40105 Transcript_13938/m.40105 type:complete len:253 (-) Transcript_13938:320-1078(-)